MSTSFGNKLPPRVLGSLHHDNTERENSAIFLLTSDDSGVPHVALLSPFQVVTTSPKTFMVSVHKGTRSQKFLEKQKKGTLIIQMQPAVDYVKFRVEEAAGWSSARDEILYSATPLDVLEDYSDKAPFISELRFDSKEILEDYTAGFQEIRRYINSH